MFCFLKKRLIFCILLFMTIVIVSYYKVVKVNLQSVQKTDIKPAYNYRKIIWWNHMLQDYDALRSCGPYVCHFSGSPQDFGKADVILFYGTKFEDNDFPLPRAAHQLWAMFHDESPINSLFVSNSAYLKHFNITATTSRYSDFPLTSIYMPKLNELTTRSYMKNLTVKAQFAPVLFINSNCNTPTNREHYVRELMQYIAVDSYGACLNNKKQNLSLRYYYYNHLYDVENLEFLSNYKFILAIENAVCHDYITEKFWRPLVVGAIPIYFGSPTIRDWQPNEKSVIYIRDFKNAKVLAEFLQHLNENDTEYMSYFAHKSHIINNRRLLNKIRQNSKLLTNEHAFECHVCKTSWEWPAGAVRQANINHYHCPLPLDALPLMNRSVVNENPWPMIMRQGQCKAQAFDKLLNRNVYFTKYELYKLLKHCFNIYSYK